MAPLRSSPRKPESSANTWKGWVGTPAKPKRYVKGKAPLRYGVMRDYAAEPAVFGGMAVLTTTPSHSCARSRRRRRARVVPNRPARLRGAV
ncbi:DUF7019 family protein [Nonomuraea sp. SBT364]|uniref:DUF7019 family protein n=1 Tax=Nonomuraea sp. SBT364 TaxID=1580530 RepID=UPI003FA614AA